MANPGSEVRVALCVDVPVQHGFCNHDLTTKVETIEWMEFAIKCFGGQVQL